MCVAMTTTAPVHVLQPFVHHHLEKTSVRNQKAKQQKGKCSRLFLCIYVCVTLSLSIAVKASLNVKLLDVSPPYWLIFRQIWVHAVSVFLVFGVSLSVFPAVVGIIESTVPNPKASDWTGKH